MVFFFCNGPVTPVRPVASVSPAAMRTESDKSFDFEKFIGKSWMGIMASVLIFISLIMFTVSIAFIARKGILTFSIVGNVGINIAIILGVSKCAVTNDIVKFGVLAIFLIWFIY